MLSKELKEVKVNKMKKDTFYLVKTKNKLQAVIYCNACSYINDSFEAKTVYAIEKNNNHIGEGWSGDQEFFDDFKFYHLDINNKNEIIEKYPEFFL